VVEEADQSAIEVVRADRLSLRKMCVAGPVVGRQVTFVDGER